MASLVREAVDQYLATTPDAGVVLEEAFGSLPELELPPRDEWERG